MSRSQADPPDQSQRTSALNPSRSVLVQAPAGSGKTDLLTRRFLRLLSEVDDPTQIVAITFTRAAAAEMRHRILSELENAQSAVPASLTQDDFSVQALAAKALERSRKRGWQLIDLPAQLRITTIDSFCRELALQQPLLTRFGGELNIAEQPAQLYRVAARRTLEQLEGNDEALCAAIEHLLLWRDNSWNEIEEQLVEMLETRDRWMQDFVLQRDVDWHSLRSQLEHPFATAIRVGLSTVSRILNEVPKAKHEAMALARFACMQSDGALYPSLATIDDFGPLEFTDNVNLEAQLQAWRDLSEMLLTREGEFRKQVNKAQGFPAENKEQKSRLIALIDELSRLDGFKSQLASIRELPSAHYTDDEWEIVRACFLLLRHAVAELHIAFAEAGAVDFIEVAQIANRILSGDDGMPSDAAIHVADGIHHLLVDEFQDTSRRQHQLLASLASAWPDSVGRTLFVVGDPMQSIYFFRDADAELFPRVRQAGLELPEGTAIPFVPISLTANFRSDPTLVNRLNEFFTRIFASDDGSGLTFTRAEAVRKQSPSASPFLSVHADFMPVTNGRGASPADRISAARERESSLHAQTCRIVDLIQSHMENVDQASAEQRTYRIAVLGRTRASLVPIAKALREAAIPFRAVELEKLRDRMEVQDALALGRALLNAHDRVAWLGVLRAPWCGLSLADLHLLTSADDPRMLLTPITNLLRERVPLLSDEGRSSITRLLSALDSIPRLHSSLPTATLGTWLEQAWMQLGGAHCVDATGRANLELLWQSLDALPAREADFLGPELDLALERLTAQPDPAASTACGVQLMTIHKSKGLEFEVVIVPDLQAKNHQHSMKLLSWLERGVEKAEDSQDITEFLIAPIQPKREDRGNAKKWVDRVYRERERQEMRRILYVAATRARDELHLFMRPSYRQADGSVQLVEPSNSLLATAWPALQGEVQRQFEDWKNSRSDGKDAPAYEVETLAASEDNLISMPAPARPNIVYRLPADFTPASLHYEAPRARDVGAAMQLYERHHGGLISRVLGSATHKLLEETARLRKHHDWDATRASLLLIKTRTIANIRAVGFPHSVAAQIAESAFACALSATEDALGQWILSPHIYAEQEVAWTGLIAGALHSVRADRVFRAGAAPLIEGDNTWWIIDYKTAYAENMSTAEALLTLRKLFAPQLAIYAGILRSLHGDVARLNAGLYYPRMALLDWWAVED